MFTRTSSKTAPLKDNAKNLKILGTQIKSVGRLDKDTTGLLLLSNDGNFIYKLSHPSFKHSRTYHITVKEKISLTVIKNANKKGIKLTDGLIACKIASISNNSQGFRYSMIIFQGKKRIVRRAFSSLGHPVLFLNRVSFSGLNLPTDLKLGDMRELNPSELKVLMLPTKI